MTGPLDCLTTFRLGESVAPILGAPASLAACWARASGVQVAPVIAAAAPMTALRIRNERRSRWDGMAWSWADVGASASFLGEVGVFMALSSSLASCSLSSVHGARLGLPDVGGVL